MFKKIRGIVKNAIDNVRAIVKRNLAKMRNAINKKRNTSGMIIAENFTRGFVRGFITYFVIYAIVVMIVFILEVIFALIVMAFSKK